MSEIVLYPPNPTPTPPQQVLKMLVFVVVLYKYGG